MNLQQYEELLVLADRPFVRENSDNGTSPIIIPTNHVEAFFVATSDTIRAASRPCPKDQVRSRLSVTPWATGKTKADGKWERFVTTNAGTGQKLSNQRSLRVDQYIADFDAYGAITFSDGYVKPSVLKNALEWGGENVGIGSARKMGWGRFTLERWEKA
jgi:hypothetical protein